MQRPQASKPHVIMLSFERSLGNMFLEIMQVEGYIVDVVKTASAGLDLLERERGPAIILMDNFAVNEEAFELVSALRLFPGLRVRVAIIGTDAMSGGMPSPVATLYDLDAHFMMPFTVDSMLNTLEWTWNKLWRDQPSKN